MAVRIGGKQMYLWRAVDAEGEVLDVLLQAKRDTRAAKDLAAWCEKHMRCGQRRAGKKVRYHRQVRGA
jgi:transposase-like protein